MPVTKVDGFYLKRLLKNYFCGSSTGDNSLKLIS